MSSIRFRDECNMIIYAKQINIILSFARESFIHFVCHFDSITMLLILHCEGLKTASEQEWVRIFVSQNFAIKSDHCEQVFYQARVQR